MNARTILRISASAAAALAALVAASASFDCGGPTTSGGTDSVQHSGAAASDASPGEDVDASLPDGTTDAAVADANASAGDATEAVPDGAADAVADATPDAAADASRTSDASLDGSAGNDASPCSGQTATARATAAQSTGYSGTWEAYGNLYYVPCAVASDCVQSCVGAGGTDASCSVGSQCELDGCGDGGISQCLMCLPPTYWLNVAGALGLPGSGANPLSVSASDNQAFDNGYNDTLELTGFGFAVPAGSVIRGISFQVDRSADDDQASDQSVRVLKSGQPVGTDHAASQAWPQGVFATIVYGGADDTWGVSWTSADVNDSAFGVAITPQYLSSAGNDTVSVDSVSASVVYAQAGCP